MKGLEPPRLSTPDPKSGAATNYATSAKNQAQRYLKNITISGINLKNIAYFNEGQPGKN
jgi:hypothetical protein